LITLWLSVIVQKFSLIETERETTMLLKALLYLFLGWTTGTLSGLLDLGGGSLITPALIYLFCFSQHIAQGTSV
jgi:uncharacterized membrane protein YfcA